MKWIIDDSTFGDARAAAEYVVLSAGEEAYDEMLDDVYGDVEICGYTYSASLALCRTDEIAYRCGYNDWSDSEAEDIADTLEAMSGGEEEYMYGNLIVCVDDDMEEEEG